MDALLSTRIGVKGPVPRGNATDKWGIQTRLSSNGQRISSRSSRQKQGNMQICAAMQHQSTDSLQPEIKSSPTVRNAPLELTQRLLANIPDAATCSKSFAVVGVLAAAALLASPEVAMAAQTSSDAATAHPIADIAENTDFWANVLRYISYFFSVLLGTAYVAIKPIINLLKRPTTAVLVIIGGAALYLFVSTTVGAMLGLNDIIEYAPSSIVTPMN